MSEVFYFLSTRPPAGWKRSISCVLGWMACVDSSPAKSLTKSKTDDNELQCFFISAGVSNVDRKHKHTSKRGGGNRALALVRTCVIL